MDPTVITALQLRSVNLYSIMACNVKLIKIVGILYSSNSLGEILLLFRKHTLI